MVRSPRVVWPSGDGTRIYVGLENADQMIAIDTLTSKVVATVPIGQGAQAIVYVPNVVPEGDGTQNLQPLGLAGESVTFVLKTVGAASGQAPTSVSLFDQGSTQVMEGSVTGLLPKHAYVMALATLANGKGQLEPLIAFMTNPAGAAIVNAIGQIVRGEDHTPRRYLTIVPGTAVKPGAPVHVQVE